MPLAAASRTGGRTGLNVACNDFQAANLARFFWSWRPCSRSGMAERRTVRNNRRNTHVGGFVEEVTTTTPFDMTMLSELG